VAGVEVREARVERFGEEGLVEAAGEGHRLLS
jgi:hypothetical protein